MNLEKVKEQAACTNDYLADLMYLCNKAPPGDFMECGVLRGGTAAILISNSGPKRRVWLCDSFKDCTWKGPEDTGIEIKQSVGYNIPEVQAYMKQFEVPLDNVSFVRGLFKDTLPDVMKRIKKLALVHFDGDWYNSVMQAFPHILKKLCPGGILIIHDYPVYEGLTKAVHKFIDKKDLHLLKPANAYYIKGGRNHG